MRSDHARTLRNALVGFGFLLTNMVGASADKPLPPEFDLPQVTVEFKVDVLGILPVSGEFRDVRGSFGKSGADRNPALNITVRLDSVDTQNPERDRLLRSPVFFDTERFPSIRFNNVRMVSTRDGARRLAGELTLRGVRRPLIFSVSEPQRETRNRTGASRAVAARATISRSAFGLDAFPVVVGDEVELTVYLEGDLAQLQKRVRRMSSDRHQPIAWSE
jgi:polyisoprenoid-binding protein YceI